MADHQDEMKESARDAGLRYWTDDRPGISRKKRGKYFRYFEADGTPIKDKAVIQRINKLAIPPAYRDAWICPDARGHLQATGIDARGRKQYRYHAEWRAVRDADKYDRMIEFGKALPAIRRVTQRDLSLPEMPERKVLATIVTLLERTLIRVGSEEYAKENESYGLTTLRNKHVEISGHSIQFEFRGKSKVHHAVDLHDRQIAAVIRGCQELPGYELFKWQDDAGEVHKVASEDVNDYIREIAGEDFTAKDFRTWEGTVLAATALRDAPDYESETEAKRIINEAVASVAAKLRNTRAVCRKCYIHPAVIDAYMRKDRSHFETKAKGGAGALDRDEVAVMALIQKWKAPKAPKPPRAPRPAKPKPKAIPVAEPVAPPESGEAPAAEGNPPSTEKV